jgi:hypothetical protein
MYFIQEFNLLKIKIKIKIERKRKRFFEERWKNEGGRRKGDQG